MAYDGGNSCPDDIEVGCDVYQGNTDYLKVDEYNDGELLYDYDCTLISECPMNPADASGMTYCEVTKTKITTTVYLARTNAAYVFFSGR